MAGTPDAQVAPAALGTPDEVVSGPYVRTSTTPITDVGPIAVNAPNLLSQAADRADVEADLNDLRARLNELLAVLRESGAIGG